MSEIKFGPLSQADIPAVEALLYEEERIWLKELDWDYDPIRQILCRFIEDHLLPGFVATRDSEVLGYAYFLVARAKGMIGTVYAHGPDAQFIADEILTRAIESLKGTRNVRRIEAQIIALNGLDLNPAFAAHGFNYYPRHYLELDLHDTEPPRSEAQPIVVSWSAEHTLECAEVAYRSYRKSIDGVISEDYGSVANCESYIRSLVDNPGCGIFLADCSFVAIDGRGRPCGFILSSQLSPGAAMIPQISVHPAHQGQKLGSALMSRAFGQLRSRGFRTARLTVSRQNRRAYDWYERLGFRNRRDFGAYVWQREKSKSGDRMPQESKLPLNS